MLGRHERLTNIIAAIERGEPHVAERLLPLVYDELRQLAGAQMACEELRQSLSFLARNDSLGILYVR
jgi:hypothetical protein